MATASQSDAHDAILQSIRAHLAESERVAPGKEPHSITVGTEGSVSTGSSSEDSSLIEMFRNRLESVSGSCFVARDENDAAGILGKILSKLRSGGQAARVALSDAPLLSRLAGEIGVQKTESCPTPAELFGYDVGVTTAQGAIAETGTLVLESDSERHRLVSLLPPVHIALVQARDICLTLGEALKRVRHLQTGALSRTITFITGPSRTADIELTLAIGVHGPKELYVIIIEEQASIS